MIANWESVTATDRYTVVFKFKTPSAGVAFQSIADRFPLNVIEPPEVVKEQGGAITDIRVRKAMQMAINRKDIARSYYGGTAPETPCGIITQAYKGYAYDYG